MSQMSPLSHFPTTTISVTRMLLVGTGISMLLAGGLLSHRMSLKRKASHEPPKKRRRLSSESSSAYEPATDAFSPEDIAFQDLKAYIQRFPAELRSHILVCGASQGRDFARKMLYANGNIADARKFRAIWLGTNIIHSVDGFSKYLTRYEAPNDDLLSKGSIGRLNRASCVRRIYFGDEDVKAVPALLSKCPNIEELATSGFSLAQLFRSPQPGQPSALSSSTHPLHLLVTGRERHLLSAERRISQTPFDTQATQRVTHLTFAQSRYPGPIQSLAFLSHTFPSLTHLSLRCPSVSFMPDAPIASFPNLECIVYLGTTDRLVERWDVLMTHIFRDRRCLYLPAVPNEEEQTRFAKWWDDDHDVWEEARRYTANEATKILMKLYGSHLKVHDTSAMRILTDLLSGPRSQQTCATPIKAGDMSPNAMAQRLTLEASVQNVEGAPLAIRRLAPVAWKFELSASWFDRLFCLESGTRSCAAGTSVLSNSLEDFVASGLHVVILGMLDLAPGKLWPKSIPSSTITHLSFDSDIGGAAIAWNLLPSLEEVAVTVPGPRSIPALSHTLRQLKAVVPGLQHVQLICQPILRDSLDDFSIMEGFSSLRNTGVCLQICNEIPQRRMK